MSQELDLAGRVVELVKDMAGQGAEAEVVVDHTALALTRFANSAIHQNVAEDGTALRLRLHVDGRTATGSSTVVSDEALRALVERTAAAARLCPPDAGWPGLTAPGSPGGGATCDPATANAVPDDRAQRVRDFVDAAGGLETAGYCRTIAWSAAFANTAGHSAYARSADAAMDGIARRDGVDGVARLVSTRLADLDGGVLGARAAAKVRAGRSPRELAPGRYEVVLEPTAVADLLQNLAFYGFNGKVFNERRSFAEPGAQQFDATVTLVDDPLAGGGVGLPFDIEGTNRRRLALVERGTTASVAHDRRTAVEANTESTGHAFPGSSTWGPIPLNLMLAPGGGGATGEARRAAETDGPAVDADVASLVADVRRGLLVSDFWYTRVLDPKSLVVTGLTRNGVWLIEDGEVTTPVQNFRFTQSYPQALAPGAVAGIGARATALPDGWGTAWWSAPALRLTSWNFTGGASG
jgi:predicted Zn-dependent protease